MTQIKNRDRKNTKAKAEELIDEKEISYRNDRSAAKISATNSQRSKDSGNIKKTRSNHSCA
jgi:hypothetical protein